MKYSLLFFAFFTSLWNVCLMENDQDFLREVRRGNWEFTDSIYSAMTQASVGYGNILFSPLSLHVILAMTYTGTEGGTAQQMSRVLHLPNVPDHVKSGFKQLLKLLPSKGNVTLEVANKMFPAITCEISESYAKNVANNFEADVETVDYSLPKQVAKLVNEWASKRTHAKITEVLPEDGVDPTTRMLLVNAVYFKGDWAKAFDKARTSVRQFHVADNEARDVDMMQVTGYFGVKKSDEIGAVVLELPYTDEDTSLIVVLPFKVNGLPGVEKKLREIGLQKIVGAKRLMRRELDLSFPKFYLDLSTNLKDLLVSLGMTELFTTGADLSGMTADKGVYVSEVMHKTMMEVGEEGTVAAAVTSVQVMLRSLPMPPLEVVVDHPFVFALISRRAGVALFMGRYTGREGGLSMDSLREARSVDKSGRNVAGKSSGASSRVGAGAAGRVFALLMTCCAFRHRVDKS